MTHPVTPEPAGPQPPSPHVTVGADEVYIDTVHITRPIGGGVDVFRHFHDAIDAYLNNEQTTIGQITGWIGWAMLGAD